jgi:transposase InsO family protein
MPWNVSGVVEQRSRFLKDYDTGEYTLAELSRVYEISRQTAYNLLERREQDGNELGVRDRSRTPQRHPNQTPAWQEQVILELRRRYPRWGPRKLLGRLQRDQGDIHWPVASTVGELLRREGLTIPPRKRRRTPPYMEPFVAAQEPNLVWCMDFKGHFRTGDGERIDPFTLSDAHSRYLLRCQAVERTNTEQVRSILEAAFREYGLPHAIRSDNGPPFATRAVAGLSRLSVYLMKLGIVPERIQPGHPEQNGRLERLHRTLKAETASPPAATRRAQQRAFDHFRREYNQERPHEALGQRTPESCYSVSLRVYPSRVPEPEYGRFMKVRRVQVRGQFKWKDQHVFLTESLAGEAVGLEQIDDRYFTIYFCTQPVARFDSYQLCTQPLPQKKTKLRK